MRQRLGVPAQCELTFTDPRGALATSGIPPGTSLRVVQAYGNFLERHNRRDEAIPHYQEAIAMEPFFADTYLRLGIALVPRLGRQPITQNRNGVARQPAVGVKKPEELPARGPDGVVQHSYQAANPGELPGVNIIFDGLAQRA
mgnify:CR=1 FL=1